MSKILIVGNGSTSVDREGNEYINSHTGEFLNNLSGKGYSVSFLQFSVYHDYHSNLRGYKLNVDKVSSLTISTKKSLFILNAIWIVCILHKYKFVYIFFPGKLGSLIASLCLLLNKPYGLYIRGERYSSKGAHRFIIRNAKFIITVSPTFQNSLKALNKKVSLIKPMNNIGIDD